MKDKKYLQVGDHCLYIVEHKGTAHNICNLKHSVPQEIPIAFYNGSNCDYHFMIKVLYRRKYRKIHKFCSSNRKWRKNTKIYLSYYNLLLATHLWQAHYQILSIIFLKECKYRHHDKNVKLLELNISTATIFLNIQTLKMT